MYVSMHVYVCMSMYVMYVCMYGYVCIYMAGNRHITSNDSSPIASGYELT